MNGSWISARSREHHRGRAQFRWTFSASRHRTLRACCWEEPPVSLVRDAAIAVILLAVAVGLAWLAQQLYFVALNLWGAQ
jgi:hypothetical protein